MGLTKQSTWLSASRENSAARDGAAVSEMVIALAGNPNTGKSTVFNSLTGLNQHTGNWPGKTVTRAQGRYRHREAGYTLVDLPGTYSLLAKSAEEEVARDFICFGNPDAVVVVTDATCLERNLNLALQVLEITARVVVCVNLIDEARRKKIRVHLEKLSGALGVPIVGTNARNGQGLHALKEAVRQVAGGTLRTAPLQIRYSERIERAISLLEPYVEKAARGRLNNRWFALRLLDSGPAFLDSVQQHLALEPEKRNELCKQLLISMDRVWPRPEGRPENLVDEIVAAIVSTAERIGEDAVTFENERYNRLDQRIDDILTSRILGIPIMVALLGAVFWITITGANYPSQALASGVYWIEGRLSTLCITAGLPDWLRGILLSGVFRTMGWVVSVMLPPMAIFFPLFTLLEDLGYLPRIAFNLDHIFKKVCAHGKQALTMCMGFGCNAAGVIACRIIDSPRERLIAVITNNFVPCNGRFPILISLAVIFLAGAAGAFQSLAASGAVLGTVISGVFMTLAVSKLLSRTILKGLPSSFTLELPPYRKPQVGRVLVRSLFDRTLFVLGRAVLVAAPAGAVIWLAANTHVGEMSLLDHCASFLQPFGYLLGLDGYILAAFLLGLPANEIVIPIVIMSYMATGSLHELATLEDLRLLLVHNGWNWLTAVCTMLFAMNHFPCGTTLLTIRKETGSLKWTLVSFLVPTAAGVLICFCVAQAVRLLGLL
ncbi:MAG: ferrous iron transport protein B [Bacillota bacterium]